MTSGFDINFSTAAISYLAEYAEWARRESDPLRVSGFLNTENCKIKPEAINNFSPGQLYSIDRTNPLTAVQLSDVNYHRFDYPRVALVGSTKASVSSVALKSGALQGTFAATNETNIGLTAIAFDKFTHVNGVVFPGGDNEFFHAMFREHFIAMDFQRTKAFFDNLERAHDIKTDYDGAGITGNNTSFAVDCPRAPYALTTVMNDPALDPTQRAILVFGEFMQLADAQNAGPYGYLPPMSRSGSQQHFLLANASTFRTLQLVFNPAIIKQYFYKGVQDQAPGSFGLRSGMQYFDVNNLRIVNIDDRAMHKSRIVNPNDAWRCYMMPSSAVRMIFSPVSIGSMLRWAGTMDILKGPDVARSARDIMPNTYGVMDSVSRADEIVERYARKGGVAPDPLAMENVYQAYFDRIADPTDPNYMAITFHVRCNLAVLRAQPQYIQAIDVPLTSLY